MRYQATIGEAIIYLATGFFIGMRGKALTRNDQLLLAAALATHLDCKPDNAWLHHMIELSHNEWSTVLPLPPWD